MIGNVFRTMLRGFLPAALVYLALPAPRTDAAVAVGVSVNFFHDDLAPYGRWVTVGNYGECWAPRVSYGWRPYVDGRWELTDYGWTWVSDDPWGWAAYHYGRWTEDPSIGWVWVPGDEWAPAWVSWRYGGDYVGWAPLPPRARFVAGVGIDLGPADLDFVIAPSAYTFVQQRYFVDVPVRRYAVPIERNTALFRSTTNSTSYAVNGRFVVNRGVPVEAIERRTSRPIQRLALRDTTDPRRTQLSGREVQLFRPPVTQETARLHREGRPLTPTVQERERASVRRELPQARQRDLTNQQLEHERQQQTVQDRQAQQQRDRRAATDRQAQQRRDQSAANARQAQERRDQTAARQRQAQQDRRDQMATRERQAQERRDQTAARQRQAQQERDQAAARQRQAQQDRRDQAAAHERQALERQQAAQARQHEAQQQAQAQRQARVRQQETVHEQAQAKQQAVEHHQQQAREQAQAKQQAGKQQTREPQQRQREQPKQQPQKEKRPPGEDKPPRR
jgi:hypothetical protein